MTGLRQRPLWISALALGLWTAAAALPVQIMGVYGHPPWEWTAIWARLSTPNRVLVALAPVAALGVGRVTRWGWWAAVAFFAAAIANNAVVLAFPSPYPAEAVVLGTACLAGVGAWIARPSVARFFASTQFHWWKPSRRRFVAAPVRIEGRAGVLTTTSVEISRTGLFVRLEEQALAVGERVRVRLRLEDRTVRCLARVVRCATPAGKYPRGAGLRFEGFVPGHGLRLRLALRSAAA